MATVQSRAEAGRALRPSFPRRWLLVSLLAMAGAFSVVLSGHGAGFLQRLEQGVGDYRTALFSDRITTDHPDIVIVSVGSNVSPTRSTFDRNAVEMDRNQLARLLDMIDDSAPRAIGFDVPLNGASDPLKDQNLQRSLREARSRVILGVRQRSAEPNLERRVWLDRFMKGTNRPMGHITTLYDEGVNRAIAVDSGVQALGPVPDSFSLLVARTSRPDLRRDFSSIAWLQKVDDQGIFSRFMNVGGKQPFHVLYADDLLDSSKPAPTRQLAGRLVLVTTGLAEIDRHPTPLTAWTGEALAPIQIQAQAIAQLLDRRTVREIDTRSLRLALFTLACLAGLVGWYRGPGWHVIGTLLAIGLLVALDALAYSWRDLLLPIVPAIIVWLLGEAAGRTLRGILNWEERHGLQWPLEEAEHR